MLDFDLLKPLKRHAAAIILFFVIVAAGLFVLNRQAVKFQAEMRANRDEADKVRSSHAEKLRKDFGNSYGK